MPANPRDGKGPGAGDLAGVGLGFAASVALFLFLGMWADRRLDTSPWLLILGAFIGGAAGFWSMYRRLVVAPKQNDRETMDRK
ncbi:AtpZ/AtpI family protein [Longimicrobium sp.]|uniref:AtpZ/AtpI family protein n=1 Tax=Longimicrobium sp. TaxID=2029185 RepID=UPI002ED7776E